jgi:hypothetical protein
MSTHAGVALVRPRTEAKELEGLSMTKRTVMWSIAVLCRLGIAATGGQAARAISRDTPVQKTNANGEIQMLNPHQKIKFNVQTTNVEYRNYDYPGGLNYTSTITCSWDRRAVAAGPVHMF